MRQTYDWRRAKRALDALLANPDDTRQVFVIIDSLSGKSPGRNLRRLARDPIGKKLLADKPQLLRLLEDRAYLQSLPAGSLGRAYLEFIDTEGITAAGLVDASKLPGQSEPAASSERLSSSAAPEVDREPRHDEPFDPDLEYLHHRMRDSHDLWHAVTGYKGDLIGEGALLAFSFAQSWNPAVGLIILAGFLRGREIGVRRQIVRGFLRGIRAKWMIPIDWENQLARPLADVRRELRVGSVPKYVPVRTSQFAMAAPN
jgi:ubiquinone biosynthesis protein COQ4